MNKEKLDDQLIEKTIEQRNKMLEEAKAKAERILKNAEEERQRIMEQNNAAIQSVIGSELKAVHDRIVGQAQLQGRRKILEARHELLSKVQKYALEDLKLVAKRGHPDFDYDEILVNLLLEAINAIDEQHYFISANEDDLGFLRENLESIIKKSGGKKIELREKPIEVIGGIYVSNADAKKKMENTIELRLENASKNLQSEVAEKLGVI
jgi:vacuolar-type H+-ATPase subunit E/Vma4